MKHDGSIALFQYWNRLRNGRPAPKRTEIEPADIKRQLADTFILEKDARGEPVFRLAGTRLCAIFGRDLKGFAFASLWPSKDQRLVARLADGTFNSRTIVVMNFSGTSRGDRTNSFELILLPLDGGQQNPRCMGSVVAIEKPFWLGADPIVATAIETIRVVDPERDPVFLSNRPPIPVPGLAPTTGEVATPLSQGARRIRHLLVLEGGRTE